jgi:hypothetical protein
VIALGSRRVVHVGVTRHPTGAWVAQQLREATPDDQRPSYLIRDNDSKYGPAFARVAAARLRRVLQVDVVFVDTARPHQGPQQRIPASIAGSVRRAQASGQVQPVPGLGGLHHAYQRAA